MSRTELETYNFGKIIMNEIELFKFEPISIKPRHQNDEHCEIYHLDFLWEWNGYKGNGQIAYNCYTHELCNKHGDKRSQITIGSDSPRDPYKQNKLCKHVSELYNDESLAALFEMILEQTNLESTDLSKKEV